MSKRISKKVVNNVTAESFDEAFSVYAAADAREASINAKMDEQFTKIREKYADELAQCKDEKERTIETLETYCHENYDALFPKKKSYDTVHGVVGFRTGTPTLKTRKGFTWSSVLELLKVKLPSYVRTKEEPNKELLLANREQPEVVTAMPSIGVEVIQAESFFIELKKEAEVN